MQFFTGALAVATISVAFEVPTASANSDPLSVPYATNWEDPDAITTDNNWSAVPGVIGYRGDDLTALLDTDPANVLADGAATPQSVLANRTNPAGLSTGGIAEFDETTFTMIALQASGTADAPHVVFRFTTVGAGTLTFSYQLHDWDSSSDNAIQPVALQYRVGGTGNWANVPGGYTPDATLGPNVAGVMTPVIVNLPADAENVPLLELRILTTNRSGNDEWVGVNNVSLVGTADTVAPQTTLDPGGPVGIVSTPSASFTFSSDEPGTFQCTVDAGPAAACTSPHQITGLADGPHSFQVVAIDNATNVDPTPETRNWTVDTTAPTVAFTGSHPTGVTTSRSAQFMFTRSEPGTFECTLNGAVVSGCASPLSLSNLTDGTKTLSVRGRDTAGNLGPAITANWTVDTTAPTVAFTGSHPTGVTTSRSGQFTFTRSEPGTFVCALNGTTITNCASPLLLTNQTDGTKTLSVRGRDTAGNLGPAITANWTVDTKGPTVTIKRQTPAAGPWRTAKFTFTRSEPGSYRCTLNGIPLTSCGSTLTLTQLAVRKHTLSVRGRDSVGNLGPVVTTSWQVTPLMVGLTAKGRTLTTSVSPAGGAQHVVLVQRKVGTGWTTIRRLTTAGIGHRASMSTTAGKYRAKVELTVSRSGGISGVATVR